ncbi:MAG: hypothetical protein EORIYHIE_002422 [Candidatus Fervidibacter sp.]|jgi:hypothetical protein
MSSFGLSDFLEGSAPALQKILGTSEDVPFSITKKIFRRIRRCAIQSCWRSFEMETLHQR